MLNTSELLTVASSSSALQKQEVGMCKTCEQQTVFVETFMGYHGDGWVRLSVEWQQEQNEIMREDTLYPKSNIRSKVKLLSEKQLSKVATKPQLSGAQLKAICVEEVKKGASSIGKWLVPVFGISGESGRGKWQRMWDQVGSILRHACLKFISVICGG